MMEKNLFSKKLDLNLLKIMNFKKVQFNKKIKIFKNYSKFNINY